MTIKILDKAEKDIAIGMSFYESQIVEEILIQYQKDYKILFLSP